MVFNSFPFFVFFAVVFPSYWALKRYRRPQNLLLLLASYVFYGWWDVRFLLLLIGTTLIDYFAVRRLERSVDHRKGWMIFSVCINLTVLSFFKYFGFFADSLATLGHHLGMNIGDPALHFLLPVGISFYVFHEISYAVDVYRGRINAEHDLVTYAVYIAFFPQLVAGPITRASHMLPQFRKEREFPDAESSYSAFVLILSGLFKKVVLADGVATIVRDAFSSPSGKGAIPLAVGMFAFSIQIYGDFAGYTDIARGVARLLGIDIPRNFEQPYLSRNITEFWRTWHISLSSWLRDYLYIPLGGSQNGEWNTYRNLMITMLLGGLWHGASWTFVVWGALHGLCLSLHRAFGRKKVRDSTKLPTSDDLFPIVGTFLLVSLLWVLFRSSSFSAAMQYYSGFFHGLIGPKAGAWKPQFLTVLLFGLIMLGIDVMDRRRRIVNPLKVMPAWSQGAIAGLAFAALIVWSGAPPVRFIYFQF